MDLGIFGHVFLIAHEYRLVHIALFHVVPVNGWPQIFLLDVGLHSHVILAPVVHNIRNQRLYAVVYPYVVLGVRRLRA